VSGFRGSLQAMNNIKTEIYTFTLAPKLRIVLKKRDVSTKEKERIKYHYQICINNPPFGEIIDNSEQSAEETTEIIYNKLHI